MLKLAMYWVQDDSGRRNSMLYLFAPLHRYNHLGSQHNIHTSAMMEWTHGGWVSSETAFNLHFWVTRPQYTYYTWWTWTYIGKPFSIWNPKIVEAGIEHAPFLPIRQGLHHRLQHWRNIGFQGWNIEYNSLQPGLFHHLSIVCKKNSGWYDPILFLRPKTRGRKRHVSLLYRYNAHGSHIDLHGLNIETGVASPLVTHIVLTISNHALRSNRQTCLWGEARLWFTRYRSDIID